MNSSRLDPIQTGKVNAFFSLFNERQHISLAVPHNLACILVAPDLAALYRAGSFPTEDSVTELQRNAIRNFSTLKKSIFFSFLLTVFISPVVLVVTIVLNKVHPSFNPDYGKIVSAVGAFLACWGAMLQFRPPEESFKGTMLHEKLHALIVGLLASVGSALAAIGAVWWQ